MSDVFISYSRKEHIFANRLSSELGKDNRTVWIDRARIELTSEWWEEIKRGIEASDNFVLIMSPDSMASPVCHLEIEYARQLTKRIIPVYHIPHDYEGAKIHFGDRLYKNDKDGFLLKLYGDRNPMLLFEENWRIIPGINRIDAPIKVLEYDEYDSPKALDEADFQRCFPLLRTAIDTDIQHVHHHTYLFNRTRDWQKKGHKISDLLNGVETQEAEEWLENWERDKVDRVQRGLLPRNPQPDNNIRNYIDESRRAENERIRIVEERLTQIENLGKRTRQFRLTSGFLAVMIIMALVVVGFALTQLSETQHDVDLANTEVAVAGATLTPVQGTLEAANERISAAEVQYEDATTQIATAQTEIAFVRTEIFISGQTLTPIPPTLTQAAHTVAEADDQRYIAQVFAVALTNLRDQRTTTALSLIDDLIETYPDNAGAWDSHGVIYFAADYPFIAIESLEKAVNLSPDIANYFNNLGNAYADVSEFDEAIESFTQAINLSPGYAVALYNRGYAYLKLENYDAAVKDFTEVVVNNPNYAQAYYLRGTIYVIWEEYQKAIEDFTQAISNEPNMIEAYLDRGKIYAKLGESQSALDDFTHVIESESEFVNRTVIANGYFNRGKLHEDLNMILEALDDYSQALQFQPDSAGALYNRGNIYLFQQGRFDLAIDDFSKAIEINPTHDEAYHNRGLGYWFFNQPELAIEDITEAISINPANDRAYNSRGGIQVVLGNEQDAIEDFTKAINLVSDNASYFINRAQTYTTLGNYDEAFEDFIQAISLDPNNKTVYYSRGRTHRELNEFDAAIDDFDRAIELDSNYAEAYSQRGSVYNSIGEYETAILDFNRAIEIESNLNHAYLGRGITYYNYVNNGLSDDPKSDFLQALADWEQAETLGTTLSDEIIMMREDIQSRLSRIYHEEGLSFYNVRDYTAAISLFTNAIDLDPEFAIAYSNRGLSYGLIEEYELALQDFEVALRIMPQFADAYFNRGIIQLNRINSNPSEIIVEDYSQIVRDFRQAEALGRELPQDILDWINQIEDFLQEQNMPSDEN